MFRRFARREIPEPTPLPSHGTCNYCSTITGIHVKIGSFGVWACRTHVDLALDTFNEMLKNLTTQVARHGHH